MEINHVRFKGSQSKVINPAKKMRKQQCLSVCCVIALLGSGQAVHGEEVSPDLFELSLQELSKIKITVASKVKEAALEAPSAVTVFHRAEFQKMGVLTVEELLNFVPGFSAERIVEIAGGPYSIAVRGRRSTERGS